MRPRTLPARGGRHVFAAVPAADGAARHRPAYRSLKFEIEMLVRDGPQSGTPRRQAECLQLAEDRLAKKADSERGAVHEFEDAGVLGFRARWKEWNWRSRGWMTACISWFRNTLPVLN